MTRVAPFFRSPARRRSPLRRRVITIGVIAAALTGFAVWGVWYMRAWSVGAAVKRGLVLMQSAHTLSEIDAAFAAWEQESNRRWRGHEPAIIDYIFAHDPQPDARVRAFLSCVTGADYGDRTADWNRWYENWQRLRAGKQPEVRSAEAVRMEPRWTAPVGLTAWHSPILPIDGQIFVGSLGSSTTDVDDLSDGLVRIDGATGAALLIFTPPDRGPRDILGISGGEESLFLACRNGYVYHVTRDGELRWSRYAGAALASIPLTIDVNGDQTLDVVVVTRQDRVFAFNGANGLPLWNAARSGAAQRSDASGALVLASLAAGDVLAAAGIEIVVASNDGQVRVLAARDGAQRWSGTVGPGCYGGALVPDPDTSPGRPALIADGTGGLWSLLHSSRTLQALLNWQLGSPQILAVVAAPRTLISDESARTWLLTCSAGSAGGVGGSVFTVAGDDIRWRYTPGGVIWGTPAIADLNADRRGEIVVGTLEGAAGGPARGLLAILSHDGHCLKNMTLDAPLESSPVIADVDKDGKLEVLVADRAGVLHCFTTKGFGPVEWGLYGGDVHNTRNARWAYEYGQTPCGLQWRWRP